MAITAISGNFKKSFNGFHGQVNSNPEIMTDRISKIDSLKNGDSVSFTATPEPAEQAMIKLTEKAGDVFSGLLIKARQFAAKRLGLVNKADIANLEVDAADIKNAIDFFAKQTKKAFSVGYMSVLERNKAAVKSLTREGESHINQGQHIGYLSTLERENGHGQVSLDTAVQATIPTGKKQIGFNSPIYQTNNR